MALIKYYSISIELRIDWKKLLKDMFKNRSRWEQLEWNESVLTCFKVVDLFPNQPLSARWSTIEKSQSEEFTFFAIGRNPNQTLTIQQDHSFGGTKALWTECQDLIKRRIPTTSIKIRNHWGSKNQKVLILIILTRTQKVNI